MSSTHDHDSWTHYSNLVRGRTYCFHTEEGETFEGTIINDITHHFLGRAIDIDVDGAEVHFSGYDVYRDQVDGAYRII